MELSRLAGLKEAGVICEIMNQDGTMARRPQLEEYARVFNLKILSIADLKIYLDHIEVEPNVVGSVEVTNMVQLEG